MNYLTTTFRDFIKENLIKETKKEQQTNNQLVPINASQKHKSWMDEMITEFNKIIDDYDDIYNQ